MSLKKLPICMEYPFKLFCNTAVLTCFKHVLKINLLDESLLIMEFITSVLSAQSFSSLHLHPPFCRILHKYRVLSQQDLYTKSYLVSSAYFFLSHVSFPKLSYITFSVMGYSLQFYTSFFVLPLFNMYKKASNILVPRFSFLICIGKQLP